MCFAKRAVERCSGQHLVDGRKLDLGDFAISSAEQYPVQPNRAGHAVTRGLAESPVCERAGARRCAGGVYDVSIHLGQTRRMTLS